MGSLSKFVALSWVNPRINILLKSGKSGNKSSRSYQREFHKAFISLPAVADFPLRTHPLVPRDVLSFMLSHSTAALPRPRGHPYSEYMIRSDFFRENWALQISLLCCYHFVRKKCKATKMLQELNGFIQTTYLRRGCQELCRIFYNRYKCKVIAELTMKLVFSFLNMRES